MKKGNTTLIKISILLFVINFLFAGYLSENKPAKNISLPSLFSNNMVLQRNAPITVWGKADNTSRIKIQMDNNREVITESDENGKWQVKLKALKAGGPHILKIIGVDTIIISNIMIGDVWLCSGQSNMEMSVGRVLNSNEEIKNANYKNIRLLTVPKNVSPKPLDDFEGEWTVCSPEDIATFSAVGYFFGRELYENLNIPIGLIHSSWGGTPIEAWMNYETIKNDSITFPIIKRFEETVKDYPARFKKYQAVVDSILNNKKTMSVYQIDEGNVGVKKGFASISFKDDEWAEMNLPQYWENLKNMNIDGAVWFRKKIKVPQSWIGENLILELGSIDDFDTTYFNGVQIGYTGKETPSFWTHKRKYKIDKNLVRKENVIAVRVFDHYGAGGFGGSKKSMKIYKENTNDKMLLLAGKWKYNIEKSLDPNNIKGPGGSGLPSPPIGPKNPHSPAGLYNAMLVPLSNFAIKGAIWYQGETNAGRAYQYRTLLPNMFKDWRQLWNNPELFIGVVQLANYMDIEDEPTESDWAELREAQALTVAADKNSSLAVTIDIGEADDIHPKNKQDVGKRLALGALAKVYGKDLIYTGPVYKSYKVDKNKIIIEFEHNGSGLTERESNELKGFSIAGKDENFVWANAKIENNKVIVWSDKIKNPVAVRYAWANNPECNLYNKEGLPAVPFRTDKWIGITFGKK